MGKKGKQPAGGRAKQRAKAQKHSPGSNGAFDSGYGRAQAQFFGDGDEDPKKMFRGFSQGGPRNGFSPRDANVNLRHQTISFVSAGSNPSAVLETTPRSQLGKEMLVVDKEEDDSEEEVNFEGDFMEEEEEDEGASSMQTNIVVEEAEVELSGSAIGRMNIDSPPSQSPLAFVVDTEGDPSLAPRLPTNGHRGNGKARVARAPSPELSDASDDVVVFHGRSGRPGRTVTDTVQPQPAKAAPAPAPVLTPTPSASRPKALPPHLRAAQDAQSPHVTDDLLAALGRPPATSTSPPRVRSGWGAVPSKSQREADASASVGWQVAPSTPYWKKGKGKAGPGPDREPEDVNMLEDTPARTPKATFMGDSNGEAAKSKIADLQAEWKQVLREKRAVDTKPTAGLTELADLEIDLGRGSARRGKRGRKKSNKQLRDAMVSEDDGGSEAAYDDYMQNLAAQLAAEDGNDENARPAHPHFSTQAVLGPSMVVNGKEVADDELLKHSNEEDWEDEDSSDTDKLIGEDLGDLSDDDSELDSSDLEEHLEYTEAEQWKDEQDLRQRRQDAMTDEQIARLFAKQHEMGIEADELVIDDGVFEDDNEVDVMEGIGDLVAARIGLQDISNGRIDSTSKRTLRKGRKNGDFSYPDASALADTLDQYGNNGFDIMDLERPSLRVPKKGRKGKPPPELDDLSDEELRSDLLGSWESDRAKKRLKKAEREELRQQGLLGSAGRKGKADLGAKYLQGMTMKQVHDELRIFLQDDGQRSRPFPPMDKKDRKALHEVADALNLKSKSVGAGHNRFPVLYKTAFTAEYTDFSFEKIIYASNKGFLKNSAHKGKKGRGQAPSRGGGAVGRGGGGGFDKAAVSLRNGEVVGGNARELGKENLGHRLMEKMGWSAGMALGKEGEGMKLPVAQIMRTGRAGLG
ncbi:hypothetical protein LTR62_002552 [Meristemomyces frigidus]|uniref:Protein SQS1 n=1 Tax=Meristemomyces frigidus TaxID=1508187 RepID=A0AAN7TFK7_9PEZI|nr:hypothetical protein LTR62_002552 [Meristemomyces frigidus]